MADQHTMAELLRAPTEGYAEVIMVPLILAEHFELKHSLINMMTSDQFFGLENDNPHDHIRATRRWLEKEPLRSILTCGNLLERRTQDVLTIIENKSKVCNSRNKSIVSQVKSSDANSSYSSEIAKLTHAVNQQTSDVTTAMTAILKQFQATPPSAFVKAVEEIWVTCAGAHPYYQCLAADGNTFSKFQDNIQGYVSVAAVNYNQGNSGYRPLSVDNQIRPPEVINPLSGSTTSSSPDHLLEEFADELALIIFPPGNDDLPFDIESDLREIEYLLNHDPTKEMDSILEDSVDECNLADPNNDLFDTIPEMFTDDHTLDYSSPPLYDDFDDDLVEFEFDNDDVYNDPFDSKEDKIKDSKLLIDELDPPRSSDFLPSPKYDSFLYEDFSKVDALPSTNNEDKVFNPGILIHENLDEVNIHVTLDKNVKKISISNASLILEDFDPPFMNFLSIKKFSGPKLTLVFIRK
nr:hypothetical protein [Tanacetum cinerariifolium]